MFIFFSKIADCKLTITYCGDVGGINVERGSTGVSASLKHPSIKADKAKKTTNNILYFLSKDN